MKVGCEYRRALMIMEQKMKGSDLSHTSEVSKVKLEHSIYLNTIAVFLPSQHQSPDMTKFGWMRSFRFVEKFVVRTNRSDEV